MDEKNKLNEEDLAAVDGGRGELAGIQSGLASLANNRIADSESSNVVDGVQLIDKALKKFKA